MSEIRTSTFGINRDRVVFIDQARTLAILLMLVGHSLDQFLGEPARSGPIYQEYQFVRGISSVLFLMVSGFSFVIASFGHWDDYLVVSDRLKGRLRRIGLILLLGYVLHTWAPTLSLSIENYSPEKWASFLRFDVLQNIGLGLILLHIVVRFAGTPERFWKVAVFLLVALLAIGTITYRLDVDSAMPIEIAVMANLYHNSVFPVVPYTAYLLIGSVFGYWFWRRRQVNGEWKVVVLGAVLAVFLLGFEFVIRRCVPGGIFPYSSPMAHMPGNTFARAGCALLLICALYGLGRYRLVLPRLSYILSKDALTVYFVHLLLVYGTASVTFVFPSYVRGMSPLQVAVWIIGLILSMTLMAKVLGMLRTHKPVFFKCARHVTILSGVMSFAIWPALSSLRIAVTVILSTLIIVVVNRFPVPVFGAKSPATASVRRE